ncbi:LPS-assembly protein LptD, partial [Candidatus Aerophobetes bacterium]
MNLPKIRRPGRYFWGKISSCKVAGKVFSCLSPGIMLIIIFLVLPCFAFSEVPHLNLQADHLRWVKSPPSLIGWGNAVLEYKDMQIKAENIELNLESLDVVAEGNVDLKMKIRQVKAGSLRYNLESEEGVIFSPEGSEGSLFYRAEKVYLYPELIELKDASFTSCDLSHPHYNVKARQVKIYLEEEIIMRNVTFYLGNIPLYWTPFVIRRFKEENRILLPGIGYSQFAGWYLKTGYYFYASSDFQTIFHLDYMQKRGWADGLDVSYRLKNGRGSMQTYRIREKDTSELRWRAKLQHYQALSKSTTLRLRLDRLSDEEFSKDYLGEEYQTSFIALDKRGSSYSTHLLVEAKLNPFPGGFVERLPQISLYLLPRKIGRAPLYLRETAEVTNFRREKEEFLRADLASDLSYPFTVFRYFRVRPRLGYHFFSYQWAGDGKTRGIPYQELALSTRIETRLGNLTYKFRPILNYYHSSRGGDNEGYPSWVREIIEKKENQYPEDLVKIRLENSLRHDKYGGATGNISFQYYPKEEKFSPLEGRFRFTPHLSYLSYIDLYLLYHPYQEEYKVMQGGVGLKNKNWNLGLRVTKDIEERRFDFVAQGRLTLGDKWRFSGYYRYDLENEEIQEEKYSLWRDL